MPKLKTRELVIAASLGAISATAQLMHVGYQSPQWGMWIDVVAVSWIIAFFLFGIRSSLIVSALGALVITLFAPDTWLGASMKLVATVPVLVSFFVWQRMKAKKVSMYQKPLQLVIPLIAGIVLRALIVLPLNYYYAIPIWTQLTPSEAMRIIPWYIIVGFNVVQTLVDVVLAWTLVFKFKLARFSAWYDEQI